MKRSELYRIRDMIEKAAAQLDDADALNALELFPEWEAGKAYAQNDRVLYNGKLYKVNQSHTSQDDWTPDGTPALFSEVAKPNEILPWKQPQGAHDAYNTGDKVTHNGKTWVCVADSNVYEPGVWGWDEV